jgi:hypothetical protein
MVDVEDLLCNDNNACATINVESELYNLTESYRAATVRERLLGIRTQPLPYGRGSA